jgi:hypothetical protein
MSTSQRLEFLTRHFNDLQTIRFAPLPAAMVLTLLAQSTPHISRSVAWGMLVGFLACLGGFYRWSTVAIRRRYGSVRISNDEKLRMRRQPVIAALGVLLLGGLIWFRFFGARAHFWDWYITVTILIVMLMKILDSTNPASRRIAWTVGLVVLFGTGVLLAADDRGGAILGLAGIVWLSLSIFDFLVLRRTFADISALPTAGHNV